MSYICAKNLTRNYQVGNTSIVALNHANFTIEKGEIVVILGPSGSGKTTLLNLLGGMDTPTEGEIIIDGTDICQLNTKELTLFRREEIGFIFQFYNLIPNLNALENVAISQRLSKHPLNPVKMMEQVGMEHRHHNFPAELSGGEQQRISIARAVCKNPKLILCDEPTGALDSETGTKVLSLLTEQSEIEQHTVLIVTHNALISEIAHHIITIKDGEILSNELNPTPKKAMEVNW